MYAWHVLHVDFDFDGLRGWWHMIQGLCKVERQQEGSRREPCNFLFLGLVKNELLQTTTAFGYTFLII
jgi:hypothetical protein